MSPAEIIIILSFQCLFSLPPTRFLYKDYMIVSLIPLCTTQVVSRFTTLYQKQITSIWKSRRQCCLCLSSVGFYFICAIPNIKVTNFDICFLLKYLSRLIPSACMVDEILFGVLHISRITAIKNCLMTDKCSEYFLQWTVSSTHF